MHQQVNPRRLRMGWANSISKSNDNFTERLCNESEEHMLKKYVCNENYAK
jgi:hypothetical protein